MQRHTSVLGGPSASYWKMDQGGVDMGLHCYCMPSVDSDTGQSWLQHSGDIDLCSGLV